MYILFVNGVPALKLTRRSEFPQPQGSEAWEIIDEHGRTVAAYSPAEALAHA